MEYLAVAAICVLLYIVKGGLPAIVCVLIFLGFCAYKAYKNIEQGQIRHTLEDEQRQLAEAQRKLAEEKPLDKYALRGRLEGIIDNIHKLARESLGLMDSIEASYLVNYTSTRKQTGDERRDQHNFRTIERLREIDAEVKDYMSKKPLWEKQLKEMGEEVPGSWRTDCAYNFYMDNKTKFIEKMKKYTDKQFF